MPTKLWHLFQFREILIKWYDQQILIYLPILLLCYGKQKYTQVPEKRGSVSVHMFFHMLFVLYAIQRFRDNAWTEVDVSDFHESGEFLPATNTFESFVIILMLMSRGGSVNMTFPSRSAAFLGRMAGLFSPTSQHQMLFTQYTWLWSGCQQSSQWWIPGFFFIIYPCSKGFALHSGTLLAQPVFSLLVPSQRIQLFGTIISSCSQQAFKLI